MGRKTIIILFGFILCLTIAACESSPSAEIIDQGDQSSGASSESNIGAAQDEAPPTEPAAPTEAPSPTQEPTAEPSPTPPPTNTPDPTAGFVSFESPAGGFRFGHPEDWAADDLSGLAMVASSAELLEASEPGDEGAIMVITSGPTDEMEQEFESRNPETVISEGFEDLAFGQDVTLVDGPHAETINGLEAATATLSMISDDGRPLSAYLALIIAEPYSVVAFGAAPEAQAESYLDTFAAIGRTIEVFEPLIEETLDSTILDAASEGTLSSGDVVQGKMAPGERSIWTFAGEPDEQYDIALTPLVDGTNLTLDVVDEFGFSLLSDDQAQEIFGKITLLGLEIPFSGNYYIIISGVDEDDGGGFELVFSDADGSATTSEAEEASIAYGQVYLGTIENEEDFVSLNFAGLEGDIALVLVDGDLDLDVFVDIQDSSGQSLVLNGNDNSDFYEVVAARLPADGDYTIEIAPVFGTGDFEVTLDGPAGSMLTASSTLEEEGDEDPYPFKAEEDDLVYMWVEPASDFPFNIILINDDTDEELYGLDYDDRAFGEWIPSDGNYFFQVHTVDEDGDGQADGGGAYDFAIFGPASTQFELAVGDRVQGKFDAENGYNDYLYQGSAGDTIVLSLEAAGDGDGVLEIQDLDGSILADVDEYYDEVEVLTYTFEEDALLVIRAGEFSGGSDAFELRILAE